MITANIKKLRDPFYLEANGTAYLYGSGWVCYRNTTGRLDEGWEYLGNVVKVPEDYESCMWAPEVHFYRGAYYMFTTYLAKSTGHRGCVIFRSESPEGPFVEHSNGHFTPKDWDSIDATFYVDENGDAWSVFVHEWTSTDDGVGRMAAARLSEDLTHAISEPIELFRADDAPWAKHFVTDGCFMYPVKSGKLLMIWSNFAPDGYRMGIACSESGKVEGPWTHYEKPLYAKSLGMEYDGGHGMIFRGSDGVLRTVLHSPNNRIGDRLEMPVFFELEEKDDSLELIL